MDKKEVVKKEKMNFVEIMSNAMLCMAFMCLFLVMIGLAVGIVVIILQMIGAL